MSVEPCARGDWIQTYSGGAFYPLDPRPEDVCIEDIAHSLALQCRYGGHSRYFYSVAEHSLLVAQFVAPEHALWALLHDATEAYLVDVPRPVKRMLTGYAEVEARVMAAIAARFGLAPDMPQEVKQADLRILTDERMMLMAEPPQPWSTDGERLGAIIVGLSPRRAEREFLDAFHRLSFEAR